MLKITPKDSVFAAIALPVLFLAAYVFFVRIPLGGKVAAMRSRLAELGDAETLRAEQAVLEHRLAEGREALLAAESADLAARRDAGDGSPSADASARLRHAMASLGGTGGLRTTAYECLADGPEASPSAALLAEALGGAPALWRFTAVADYPSALAALRALAGASPPAVVERVTLEAPAGARSGNGVGRVWIFEVCL